MAGILALDVGTTAVKVCHFSSGLFPERRSVREYGLRTEGNRVECDGETYLEAIREGIRETLREGEIPDAIGLTTQGETLTVAGGDGAPLRPFLVWLDQRAEAEAEALRADFPEELFYRETGLPGATGALPLAKVMWLKKREPELFGPGRRILLLEDWLLHFLTGRFVTEKTLQTSTGWFSLRRDGWWTEAMRAAGLREEELPELTESGRRAGEVTGRAAEALGLPRGTPVYTGAMDQVAASYAMDRLRPGAVTETTGTALTVAAVLPDLGSLGRPDLPRTTVYRHALEGKYLLLPIGNTGGMCLTWFRNRFWPEKDYEALNRAAEKVAPGAEGLLFLPFLDGSVDPDFCPEARGVFFGAGLNTGREHFARAVMEGVAHLLAEMLAIPEKWGVPAGEVCSLGGGAASPLWQQIKADLCGREFLAPPCGEAAALGAAMLAGLKPEKAAREMEGAARYAPDPENREIYGKAHEKYRALWRAVRPMW